MTEGAGLKGNCDCLQERLKTDTSAQNCNEVERKLEAQTHNLNRDSEQDATEEENCDVADGFIKDIFKPAQGRYTPRQLEVESWGPSQGKPEESADYHESITELLRHTGPETRWREGLLSMLWEASSEQNTRKCLVFLHANVASGIKVLEEGKAGNRVVFIDINSAPECVKCSDWMTVIQGLKFKLTSPGAQYNIADVRVTICQSTNQVALEGFCYLLRSMLDMSWTSLQQIIKLDNEDGQVLNNTMAMLCSGYGLDGNNNTAINDLETRYPYLIKSLGFLRQTPYDQLQWQRPRPDDEFKCLCYTIHGLFRSTCNLESFL